MPTPPIGPATNNPGPAMPPRVLLINCTSPYFFYIPMGCFGLCDMLARQGIEARIFNPALYPQSTQNKRLVEVLATLQPTHVGLACHWQETAHGLLEALRWVREWSPKVATFAGGFTASYFAEDLVRTVPELDCVVVGDPEEPVVQLVQGEPMETIANLVWRDQGEVRRSAATWLIDQPLFDRLAFADCASLVDADRYFEMISTKLGFPLLLGRGCVFDCEYCGGSRHAFRLHSGRNRPIVREIPSILADLHRIKQWTTVLYLCYENDPAMIKALFRAIGDDPELRGQFTLNYGAWHLLDAEFIDLYRRAFNCHGQTPVFEFSPEVTSDEQRAIIKRGRTYDLAAMEDNFRAIASAFDGKVRIEVFFSRYHPSLSAADLDRETGAILRCKHRMLREGLPVHICFDHLSTDVASRYWEGHQASPRDFSRFLELKQQVDAGSRYPFPVDNLCMLLPSHLEEGLLVRHEALLQVLEQMERHCHELLHILLACWDDRWLGVLATILEPWLEDKSEVSFFAEPPLAPIIEALGQQLCDNSPLRPAFLPDLFRFSLNKLTLARRPEAGVPSPFDMDVRVQLDCSRMSIHEQDYLDLPPLLLRLDTCGQQPLPYQRTVCLFLGSGILALPHASYRATLRLLEQPRTLGDYQAAVQREARFDWQRHESLLAQLLRESVLLVVD